jgi:hypothetical protein
MKTYKFSNFIIVFMFFLFLGCDNSEKAKTNYEHRIGYIDPETSKYSENFKLCNDEFIVGYYSSYAPKIYKNDKISFRRYIQENYHNKGYKDTGFLNLRFHINCEGEIGNLEINELDENLELSSLNSTLVQQLVDLSINKNNWNLFEYEGKKFDTYMYLIFKLENGNVLEILP